ncbi:MAG TPA: sulfotransferase [Novosphingobium sp.]|nr:sulfotransferase [Novosphingobium sp.]
MPEAESLDPRALVALAAEHRGAGRLRDAVLACDAAIRAAPNHAGAWLERGFVFASGGSMARAGECYSRVLALDPGNALAHAGLAGIAARNGNGDAARRHATAALALDPANATATLALATVESEAGDADAARARLEPLVARLAQPEPDRSLAYTLLGDAYARLGEPSRGHDAYVRANADFAAIHATQYAHRPPHLAFVASVADALAEHDFAPGTAPSSPGAPARHLFLLGYPRSGNTLVENVLASLPDVVALEERPTLRDADRAWLADPDGLRRLAAAPEAELAEQCAAYWRKVAEAGVEVGGRTFVDMDPLKGTRLPMIARLFPEAKVLVMRRDPRDVVWSCFRTQFALTNAAMDFTTLERAARHYDAMMRVLELARERLALSFHEVRYESLVADFDATTLALCDFAGLRWDESVRRFDRTAMARGVATASAGQVRKGLYDGSGQWRPYARWLEPVMPILAPWIERLSYA